MDVTNFQHLPIEMLPSVDENGKVTNQFPYPTYVFRYPVHEGWIVGTVIGNGGDQAFSQSFVPDPDHMWIATFSDKKIQPLSAT